VRSRNLIGRSARADIRLAAGSSSMEHATIGWTGTEWLLRDLKSRNGTRVNGMYVRDRTIRLKKGDSIVFGDPREAWEWSDDSAPCPCAFGADGKTILGSSGVLLLPDDAAPTASVFSREGSWVFESGGVTRPVVDGEEVTVGELRFSLSLPSFASDETRTRTLSASVYTAIWTFRPSQDSEHVDIDVDTGQARLNMRPRSLNHLLLQLAHVRIRDLTARHDPAECGWVYSDVLSRQLGVSPEKLNVDVFRARAAIAALRIADLPAFADHHAIVERRCTTQLRIGPSHLIIARHGAAAVAVE